jgi:hypothetical protein
MNRQNFNPPDFDYEPAPVEESLRAARGILARLYDCPLLRVAGEGPCHDCGRSQVLLELGRFHVCRPSATSRQRAKEKVIAEGAEIRKAKAS